MFLVVFLSCLCIYIYIGLKCHSISISITALFINRVIYCANVKLSVSNAGLDPIPWKKNLVVNIIRIYDIAAFFSNSAPTSCNSVSSKSVLTTEVRKTWLMLVLPHHTKLNSEYGTKRTNGNNYMQIQMQSFVLNSGSK